MFVVSWSDKATNTRMMCKSCGKIFTSGPQKIRIHITGAREGATYMAACPRPYPEHFKYCMQRQVQLGKFSLQTLPQEVADRRVRFVQEEAGSAGGAGAVGGMGGGAAGMAAGGEGGRE